MSPRKFQNDEQIAKWMLENYPTFGAGEKLSYPAMIDCVVALRSALDDRNGEMWGLLWQLRKFIRGTVGIVGKNYYINQINRVLRRPKIGLMAGREKHKNASS